MGLLYVNQSSVFDLRRVPSAEPSNDRLYINIGCPTCHVESNWPGSHPPWGLRPPSSSERDGEMRKVSLLYTSSDSTMGPGVPVCPPFYPTPLSKPILLVYTRTCDRWKRRRTPTFDEGERFPTLPGPFSSSVTWTTPGNLIFSVVSTGYPVIVQTFPSLQPFRTETSSWSSRPKTLWPEQERSEDSRLLYPLNISKDKIETDFMFLSLRNIITKQWRGGGFSSPVPTLLSEGRCPHFMI